MDEKLVISAALAGAATMKSQNPAVPYTPEEFAEESYRCMNEGAAVVHIHGRDPQSGLPTPDITKIRAIVDAIRDRCPGLIINMSTAIGPGVSKEDRIAPIAAIEPDMASLNTNSMSAALANRKTGEILTEFVFENTFAMLIQYSRIMREHLVKPECELYDLGGIYNVLVVRKQGIFEEPMHFQMVFGVTGGIPYDAFNFAHMKDLLPEGASWSVCGVGPYQFAAGMTAAVNGGHIRVGLEDNIRMPGGELAKGSYEQVQWATEVARLAGREPASADEAREIFHIPK
ncbi:MAG: 3-keto-5-aminohexanoate cleavage protein [Deltaproteobacteria bacterium]|nr:3-keto-5-aminohexanoate cleavage protein [Deltaproteobacteria bacterium]